MLANTNTAIGCGTKIRLLHVKPILNHSFAVSGRMFHAEKLRIFARLRAQGIHDPVDLKMAALEQLYGSELTDSQRAGIRARLERLST